MKKSTKTTKSKKQETTKMAVAMNNAVVTHSRRQRFWGIVALVGLFMCGFMLGTDIQNKHIKTINNNINNSEISMDKTAPACEVVENMLLNNVYPDGVTNWDDLNHNVDVYTKLVQYGCPENSEKYAQMIIREKQIVAALKDETLQVKRDCQKIENLLEQQIRGLNSPDSYSHIDNAKIYANLSERGCSENHQKYVELARQELEIARALQDDNLSESDTIEVVETYKRIQMQNAAQEILDKAKKLTNPAIDFIIELEKIINE